MGRMLSILAAGLLFAGSAVAEERETVLTGQVEHGGFGGPEARITRLNGGTNLLMGGKGAWLIDHTYYVGGGGFGTVRDVKDTQLNLGYGGVLLGILREPSKKFHYYFEVLVGAGSLNEPGNDMHEGTVHRSDSLFVVEPAFGGSINFAPFATFNAGLSYRVIEGADNASVSNSDVSGLALQVNVMFGKF